MDLDEDELKATRELNGVGNKDISTEEQLKKLQEDANKKIQEAVN